MTNFKRKTVSKRFLNVIKSNVLLAVVFHASCKDFVLFKQYLEHLCGTILHETTKSFPVAGWYKIDGRFDFVTSSGDCLCLFDKVEVNIHQMKTLREGSEIVTLLNIEI